MTTSATPTQAAESVQVAHSNLIDALTGGRVLIAGGGVAGAGVLEMLRAIRADIPTASHDEAGDATTAWETSAVVVADDNTSRELAAPVIPVAAALDAVTGGTERAPQIVVASPGWRPDAALLVTAADNGIPVVGDLEAAWLLDCAQCFGPARTWVAITGTNGKTTTTAMTTAMLLAGGQAAQSVGNIGLSAGVVLAGQVRGETRVDVLVAEVSSFQLHWAPRFVPAIGCVLNLADDHLDWHGSLDAYAEAKGQVFRAERSVVALDDPVVVRLATAYGATGAWGYSAGETQPESASESLDCAAVISPQAAAATTDTMLVERRDGAADCVIAPTAGISPPGPAGIADAAAAAAIVRQLGVSPEAIASALASFRVAAHRGEIVLAADGVQWIDNSKATNPHAAAAALRGLNSVVWVAGGQLKGADVTSLVAAAAPSLKAVVVLGVDRSIIADAVRAVADIPVVVLDETDPHAAMRAATAAAREYAQAGDLVVLAPAAASLDMYTGMGQRGDLFAHYARQSAQPQGGATASEEN